MTACTRCPTHCPPVPEGTRHCVVCGEALVGSHVRLCGRSKCERAAGNTKLATHLLTPRGGARCGIAVPLERLSASEVEVDCAVCLRKRVPMRQSERTHLKRGPQGTHTLCGYALTPSIALVEEAPNCRLCAKQQRRLKALEALGRG